MGKVAEFANDWLIECGYELGYDYCNIPNIDECNRIRQEYHTGNFQSIGRIIKDNEMDQIKYWEEKDETRHKDWFI